MLHHRYAAPPDPGAPTLLLIHPIGATLGFWDACLPHWLPHLGILALDLRCAGASPAGESPGLTTHVTDIEGVRALTGATRLVPVACAVGCMVAAAYAARHPEWVQAMVLSNPTPRSTDAAREALVARAARSRALRWKAKKIVLAEHIRCSGPDVSALQAAAPRPRRRAPADD